MEKLVIDSTLNSPRVILNPEINQFEFAGESRPENVRNFYMPVLEWLEKFADELSEQKAARQISSVQFNFNFEYFNSTSAKYILDIFKSLNVLQSLGIDVGVNWHYEEDDEDMLEVGIEMSRMSKLTFEYVKVEA